VFYENSVPIHFQVRAGRPFQEIVAAARSLNADVIVISTHGQRGPVPSTLGSTTEKVIRHAPCPVIVVREKGRDLARGEVEVEVGDREMRSTGSCR
jgi:nucleotide-binding universal stress UspA family protein